MARTVKRQLTDPGKEVPIVRSELEEFAYRLNNKLLERGWSQTELAKRVWGEKIYDRRGYGSWKGRDLISNYIRAKTKPTPVVLSKIAKTLNCTPEDLAPDMAAGVIERETPSINITMIAGHEDKCLLRVNRLVPFKVALEIGNILEKLDAPSKK